MPVRQRRARASINALATFPEQDVVLGQTQTVIDLLPALAPHPDFLPAKTAVAAQNDSRLFAALADRCHNLLQRPNHAIGRIAIPGAQLRPQRDFPTNTYKGR